MLYARFSHERLEHTVHLKSKTLFALLEVRERFFACGIFHKEVQTCIRHDTSMGCSRRRGVGCKKKVRAGWSEDTPSVDIRGDVRDSQAMKIVFQDCTFFFNMNLGPRCAAR